MNSLHVRKYLKKVKYPHNSRGKATDVLCPFCNNQTGHLIKGTIKVRCLKCKKKYSVVDIVRKHEKDKENGERQRYLNISVSY